MKVLVTGAAGQLGRALVRVGASVGHSISAVDLGQLDIRDEAAVARAVGASGADVVVNAAAYTAVDNAESEHELAFAVNATGAGNVATACRAAGVPLLHVSTDYVFDGSATKPYREDAAMAPLGVYGRSKAAGEEAVRGRGGVIVRTSWLFEERGPSFVHTMLRLARERAVLRVVDDQVGCPTWADDLARAIYRLVDAGRREGTYHFCNDGVTSWHGFASAIVERARRHVALACERIDAISTSEYPTPARRPMYSVLDTAKIRAEGITPPAWTIGLDHVVAEVLR
jgi:dTDP-4-dehydrorhamnose reductase